MSCAAALATLDILEEEGCYERARRLGCVALQRLAAAPGPVDVRGVGLMIGVELPDRAAAEAVQARCLDEGLVVLLCGPGENVLRLIPPLTIADDEFEAGLDILVSALETEG